MANLGIGTKIVKSLNKYLGLDTVDVKSTELKGDRKSGGYWGRTADRIYETTKLHKSRESKYDDYQYLDDNLAEASSALNLYADNVVSGSIGYEENYNVVLGKDTENGEEIQRVIEYNEKQSRIKDSVWEVARNLTGYGDDFREVVIAQDPSTGEYFIKKAKQLPVREIIANVDLRGVFLDASKMYSQKKSIYDKDSIADFEWWRLIHFKIGQATYGVDRSIFAGAARRIGRQLLWTDEALVIARMTRAWMRYAYNIDVEGMNADEVWDYVANFMSQTSRKELVATDTGVISVMDKPPMPDEDIGIPVTKDSNQGVTVLSGDPNVGRIEDIKYLQNKFLMAVSVPKAYMAIEEGVRAKATIQQIDVQFARQVRRRQAALIPGLRQFYNIAFMINEIDPNSFKWDIVFPELATTDEMIKWGLEKIKAEIAKIYMVDIAALNNRWLFQELLQFPEDKARDYSIKFGDEGFQESGGMISLSPHLSAQIKKRPELLQMLSDLKDVIDYKISRDQMLENGIEIDAIKAENKQLKSELKDKENE